VKRAPVNFCSLQFRCPPSANALFRNSVKGRIKTKAYDEWIKAAGWEVAIQNPGCVSGPYHLQIAVRRASLRADIDNYIKSCSDLLVKMGVVDDDCHAESVSAYWSDKGEGVRVTIVAHGHKADEEAA
jgi:crossover junction endodeoxyribonuclease RusA